MLFLRVGLDCSEPQPQNVIFIPGCFCRFLRDLKSLQHLDISNNDEHAKIWGEEGRNSFWEDRASLHCIARTLAKLPLCPRLDSEFTHYNRAIHLGPEQLASSRFNSEVAKLSDADAVIFDIMHPHYEVYESSIDATTLQHVFTTLPAGVSHLNLELEISRYETSPSHEPHDVSLYSMHAPAHVTSVSLTIEQLDSGSISLAAGLSCLTQLRRLELVSTNEDPVSDSSLAPFAASLSTFQSLTALKWVHMPRYDKLCSYAEELASALSQLSSLKDLCLSLHIPEASEGHQIGAAISALTGLTRLDIKLPSVEMIATLTPLLPAQALESLSVDCCDTRLCDPVTVAMMPRIDDFLMHATHLTGLKSCRLRFYHDVQHLGLPDLVVFLKQLSSVIDLQLGFVPQPSQISGPIQNFPPLSDGIGRQLIEAGRQMTQLRSLTLVSTVWHEAACGLFQPSAVGPRADPNWSQLTQLNLNAISYFDQGLSAPPGSLIFRALCACKRLSELTCNACELAQEDIAPLRLHTNFPCLRILILEKISMSSATATDLGRAIAAVAWPSLEELVFGLVREGHFAPASADQYEMIPQQTGQPADTTLCCLLQELGGLQLSSLRKLTVTAALLPQGDGPAESEDTEPYSSSPEALAFSNALTSLLSSTIRLQSLCVLSEHLHLQVIAPCIGNLPALSNLEMSVRMDNMSAGALLMHVRGHTALAQLKLVNSRLLDSCVDNLFQFLDSLPELREIRIRTPVPRGTTNVDMGKQVSAMVQQIDEGTKSLRKVSLVQVEHSGYMCM